ncbi:MAG: non-ribosomal peptide synthetase, partial [Sphingomonas sp.]
PRTDIEATLAEIWAEVLRIEQVSVNDNFFELGGDSIQCIQVAARSRARGIVTTVQQVFEHGTIAGVATVAAVRTATEADQGLVVGDTPLTPIQHWWLAGDPSEPHHNNQAFLLSCRKPLAPDRLAESLTQVVRHHDALRLRLARESNGWRQWIAEDHVCTVDHIDLTSVAASEQNRELAIQANAIQASFDLADGPILRCALFDLGDGSQRMLIVIHHIAVDGVSWRILLEDLEAAYLALENRQSVQLPPKTTSYKAWSERLQAFALSETMEAQSDYWASLPWDRCALPALTASLDNLVRSTEAIDSELSMEETRALLHDVPGVYRTQINDVLLTALAQANRLLYGRSTLLVDLEGHGREDLFEDVDLSRTVGWFTSIFPMILDISDTSDTGASLRRIKEQLRAVPRRGVGFGVLRYLKPDSGLDILPRPEISFNYLGQFDGAIDQSQLFAVAEEESGNVRSSKARRAHAIEILGSVAGGQLRMRWLYNPALHAGEEMSAFANAFMDCLRTLIRHCAHSDGGFTPSDFPLARTVLNQESLDAAIAALGGARRLEDIYPLSPLQQGLLFHSMFDAEAGSYVNSLNFRISGPLRIEDLRAAWQQAIARHEILRTAFFSAAAGTPLQAVLRTAEMPIDQIDWRHLSQAEQSAQLDALIAAERSRGFDYTQPPLMRLCVVTTGTDEHRLVWTSHHILLDGWSTAILLGEVLGAYRSRATGRDATLPTALPYRRYIDWLGRQDPRAAEDYWRDSLAGSEGPTPIGVDRRPREGTASRHAEHRVVLPTPLDELEASARRCRVTLNSLALAAWALVFSRYSGRSDTIFGVTVAGRPEELDGVEQGVGLYINTLPLCLETPPAAGLASWLADVHGRQQALMRFQYSSLVDVQRWSGMPSGVPMFECGFVFENYPVEAVADGPGSDDLRVDEIAGSDRPHYPLYLQFAAAGGSLSLTLAYDEERFALSTIERLGRHIGHVLGQIAADPEQTVGEVELLGDSERQCLITGYSGPVIPFPTSQLAHRPFEDRVKSCPHAPALLSAGEVLSYAELNRRANRLAHRLIELGVGPEDRVAICFDRGADLVTAVLAVLKAGAAYVPLDPAYPIERLVYMIEDSRPSALLTEPVYEHLFAAVNCPLLLLGGNDAGACEGRDDDPDVVGLSSGNLAYVIYTSGSTGRPKGVAVRHRAVANLVDWVNRSFEVGPADRLLFTTSICFDLSVYDILGMLSAGGCIRVASKNEIADPERLLSILAEEPITFWDSAPAVFAQLAPLLDARPPVGGALRLAFFSGDWIPLALPDVVRRSFPKCRVISLGGATEATVWSNVHQVGVISPAWRSIPYGRPMQNARYYVLDDRLRPSPTDVPGDLYIAGECLSDGYFGKPSLTAQRFVADPFGPPGARMYRTGDRARFWEDGTMEFLGRLDGQVKLRGFRIELGEVEAALLNEPSVRLAAAMIREDRPGDRRLIAYVVPSEGAEPDPGAMRAAVRNILPDYMVPAAIVVVPAMPLTVNGKIDRAAFPAPEYGASLRDYIAPATATEMAIAQIWVEVLDVDHVGAQDDFFELGGDSLLAMRVFALIRERLDLEPPMRLLFEVRTVSGIAALIDSRAWETGEGAREAELSKQIENMSDEEVFAMLERLEASTDG